MVAIAEDLSRSASKDILLDMPRRNVPTNALITLGYSSWEAGQLEQELTQNSWLTIPADSAIIFHTDCAKRAGAAASTIGLDLAMLSHDAGHA